MSNANETPLLEPLLEKENNLDQEKRAETNLKIEPGANDDEVKTTESVVGRIGEKIKKFFTGEESDKMVSGFGVLEAISVIILYLLIGVLSYSVVFEKWSVADSLYFSAVTLSTVGYGDMGPDSHISKLFTCLFALTGVALIGIALGIIGSYMVEVNLSAVEAAREASKNSMMKSIDKEVSENEHNDNNKEENAKDSLAWSLVQLTLFRFLPVFSVLVFLAWCLSFAFEEEWDFVEVVYYTVITSTTIGYGDVAPVDEWARVFAVLFIFLAVGAMADILGKIAELVLDVKRRKFYEHLKSRELTLKDLLEMDTDDDNQVSLVEYIEFMLIAMEKVDKELMDDLKRQFDKIDLDNSGYITKDDLRLRGKKKLKKFALSIGKMKTKGLV